MKQNKSTKSNAQMSARELVLESSKQAIAWCRNKRFKRSAMIWAADEDDNFAFVPIYPKHGKYPTMRFISCLAQSFAMDDILDHFLTLARWTIQFKREKEQIAWDKSIDPDALKAFKKAEKAILEAQKILGKQDKQPDKEPEQKDNPEPGYFQHFDPDC